MKASGNGTPGAISPNQVKAARGLLGWSLDQLIAASGVPKRTAIRFENSEGTPHRSTTAAIRTALEAAGVEFIDENGGGPGVRLRKAADR
jgi:transcriptional regulator with XRE-family HTH domain